MVSPESGGILHYTDRGWHLFQTGSRIRYDVGRRWAHALGHQPYGQFHTTMGAIVDLTQHQTAAAHFNKAEPDPERKRSVIEQ